LPLEVYRRGGKLITCQYQRPCPGIKTTNYLLAMTLQAAKRRAGAIEILYTDRGWVLEASTSNFGAFFGDVLVAPKENVLVGITRATVLRLAKPFFRVSERNLKLSELARADEAFIMATNKNVAPIVSIDGKSIGRGRVGERTQKLMALFAEFMKSH
jgi:branched-chain amino acid aminotransferase